MGFRAGGIRWCKMFSSMGTSGGILSLARLVMTRTNRTVLKKRMRMKWEPHVLRDLDTAPSALILNTTLKIKE
jgi:hypothetical protein